MTDIEKLREEIDRYFDDGFLATSKSRQRHVGRLLKQCLEALPRWVPVSERLPEPNLGLDDMTAAAVIAFDGTTVSEALYLHETDLERGLWGKNGNELDKTPTHWMPLPEAPREDE